MSNDPERLKRLTLAGSFCLFDNRLRSSGNSSIVWGLLNLVIGGAIIAGNDYWGAVNLLLGVALIAAGLYERTVRDPKVIIISAVTLAGLALWNFVLIGLAALGRIQVMLGGKILFWAIAQAYGAYATWKTYSEYKMLREQSDPGTVQQVRTYVAELRRTKPEQSINLVEFDVSPGFLQATKRYRLKPIEDFYLVARYKAQLRSLSLEEVSFIARNEVMLAPQGEKWMSKKIKASVQLGSLKLERATITQEMAARLDPGLRVLAIGQP